MDAVRFKLEQYMKKLQTREAELADENGKKFYRLIEQCMEQLFDNTGVHDALRGTSGWSRKPLQLAEAARRIRENVRPLLAEALGLDPNTWFGGPFRNSDTRARALPDAGRRVGSQRTHTRGGTTGRGRVLAARRSP